MNGNMQISYFCPKSNTLLRTTAIPTDSPPRPGPSDFIPISCAISRIAIAQDDVTESEEFAGEIIVNGHDVKAHARAEDDVQRGCHGLHGA